MTYSDDLEFDEEFVTLTIDELPAPISSVSHVSHAAGHEPLIPGHSLATGAALTTVAAEAAHLYRRH